MYSIEKISNFLTKPALWQLLSPEIMANTAVTQNYKKRQIIYEKNNRSFNICVSNFTNNPAYGRDGVVTVASCGEGTDGHHTECHGQESGLPAGQCQAPGEMLCR